MKLKFYAATAEAAIKLKLKLRSNSSTECWTCRAMEWSSRMGRWSLELRAESSVLAKRLAKAASRRMQSTWHNRKACEKSWSRLTGSQPPNRFHSTRLHHPRVGLTQVQLHPGSIMFLLFSSACYQFFFRSCFWLFLECFWMVFAGAFCLKFLWTAEIYNLARLQSIATKKKKKVQHKSGSPFGGTSRSWRTFRVNQVEQHNYAKQKYPIVCGCKKLSSGESRGQVGI